MSNFPKVFSAFTNFVYPNQCLHCSVLKTESAIFCSSCTAQLEMINPKERCPSCFSADFDSVSLVCYTCFVDPPLLKKQAATFDYLGPAASLVTHLKYSNQPYLAKGAGAYMAIQWMNLGWPLPDLIVPVPLTLTHFISRGYNQSLLLAEAIGSILQCPVKKILKRRLWDYSQAGMSKKIRQELDMEAFKCKNSVDISDKIILLVDDVMTTGLTLKRCAEVLYEGYPSAVYGLTFCKTIEGSC